LELKLEVDFDARRARIALGSDGQTIDLAFQDGSWRCSAEPEPADR